MSDTQRSRNEGMATRRELRRFGKRVLRAVGLGGWKIDIGTLPDTWAAGGYRTWLGACYHETEEIVITPEVMKWPRHEVKLTFLHEVAHALLGPDHGHKAAFMRGYADLIRRFLGGDRQSRKDI